MCGVACNSKLKNRLFFEDALMDRSHIDVPDVHILHCLGRRGRHRYQFNHFSPTRSTSVVKDKDDDLGACSVFSLHCLHLILFPMCRGAYPALTDGSLSVRIPKLKKVSQGH